LKAEDPETEEGVESGIVKKARYTTQRKGRGRAVEIVDLEPETNNRPREETENTHF
jgi:hypothetical protein